MAEWYLPSDAKERLKTYVYHGVDYSYIYKFFWRPLCAHTVEKLPVWLAPNTITVAALAIVSLTHLIVAYYMPKLTVKDTDFLQRSELRQTVLPYAHEFLPPPPSWIFIAAGLALLAYQYLDNLDGHQARRTGTSSPLGLLMDHGCDAVNCIVGALTAASALSCGPCWKTWALVINTCSILLFNTWEQYYRDILILPVINGPNEGILLNVIAFFWTAVKGPQWWSLNAIEIPARVLPAVLRLPAPEAAVTVERRVLDALCPWLTGSVLTGATEDSGLAPLPFFLNMNCTAAYRAHQPVPVPVALPNTTRAERMESIVLGKQWHGHGLVQSSVLRLYGASEATIRIKYNTLMVIAVVAMGVATMVGNMVQVWLALRRMTPEEREKRYGKGRMQRRFPFVHALTRIAPLIVLVVMGNLWFASSQEDVFRRHPRIFCWTMGLLFVKIAIHIMIAHLCSTDFAAVRRTYIPFVLFGIHIALTYTHNVNQQRVLEKRYQRASGSAPPPASSVAAASGVNKKVNRLPDSTTTGSAAYAYDLDEELILYEFFAISLVSFCHLVYYAITGTAAALGVPVFSVPEEKQKALLEKQEQQKKADLKKKTK